jgi:hypothetical protein
MLYRDLKLNIQEPDSSEPDKMDTKNVTSFIANHFFIYDDNPMPGKPVRTESKYLERSPTQSFFNLLWSSIYTCIQHTIISSEAIEKKMEAKQQDHKPKKGFFRRLFGKKKKDSQ